VAITIDAEQRDALYRLLHRFGGIEETATAPDRGEYPDAVRLLRRPAGGLRLHEDIGWGERDTRTVFELTMPPEELRRLLTRLQRMSIEAVEAYLARPKEDEETAIGDLAGAVVCGQVLNALSATETEDPR
jgi:hypothetical protein